MAGCIVVTIRITVNMSQEIVLIEILVQNNKGKKMSTHNLEKMLGKKGYIKLAPCIYAYGEVTEVSYNCAGYYALVECESITGKTMKIAIWHEAELRKDAPAGAPITITGEG